MADLVIDEWIWHDLGADHGLDRQGEAFDFLKAVHKKCDRIVTVRGSRFHQKAQEALWKHTDRLRRGLARYYRDNFLYNNLKTTMVEEAELPELITAIVDDIKEPDRYLIQAHMVAGAELVVTTDGPLLAALNKHGIPCQLRERFVPDYIARHG